MMKVSNLNDKENCLELAALIIAIFRYKQLITIVQMTLKISSNLSRTFTMMKLLEVKNRPLLTSYDNYPL